jgi:hypothetical protein
MRAFYMSVLLATFIIVNMAFEAHTIPPRLNYSPITQNGRRQNGFIFAKGATPFVLI